MNYDQQPSPHIQQPTEDFSGQTFVRQIEPVERLQYLYAFRHLFESTGWMLNLLAGSLAMMSMYVVPVIGQLVFMGYQYEVIDHLHRKRTMPYPDFNFNHFGAYLGRGAPPFVAMLVSSLLLVPILIVFQFGGIFITIVTGQILTEANAPDPLIAMIVIVEYLLIGALFLLLVVAATLLSGPMVLRAGLSGSIGEGFKSAWVLDFIKKMWPEMMLAYLWLMVAGSILISAGLLMMCLGVFPAWAWHHMASTHLNWQLYELYLQRGGEPVPIKKHL